MNKISSVTNRVLFLVWVVIGFGTITAFKPKQFEGTINFKITLKGANAEQFASFLPKKLEYKVKGKNFRILTDNSNLKDLLIIGDQNVGYSINEDEKVAYKMDIKSGSGKEGSSGLKPKITGTDEFAEISGYKCKKYIVETSDPGTGIQIMQSVWVTKELGIVQPNVDMNSFMVKGLDGFPLKVEMNMMIYKLELLAIGVKRETLTEDTFVLPKGMEVKKFEPKKLGIKNPFE